MLHKVPFDLFAALSKSPKVEEMSKAEGSIHPLLINLNLRKALETFMSLPWQPGISGHCSSMWHCSEYLSLQTWSLTMFLSYGYPLPVVLPLWWSISIISGGCNL